MGRRSNGRDILERMMAAHSCLPANKVLASFVRYACKEKCQTGKYWMDRSRYLALEASFDLCKDCLQSCLFGSEHPWVTSSEFINLLINFQKRGESMVLGSRQWAKFLGGRL